MRTIRIALILAGVLIAAGGVVGLLVEQSPADLSGLALWLGAALVVHDGLLAPLLLLAGTLIWRTPLPRPVRQILTTGALVAGLFMVLALPSIIRHPVASNPTALPQSYPANLAWLTLAVLGVTALTAVWVWLRSRRDSGDRSRAGRRAKRDRS